MPLRRGGRLGDARRPRRCPSGRTGRAPQEMDRADMDRVRDGLRRRDRDAPTPPASTCSSCTWRTATCCRASSRRSRNRRAATSTAARSRTACASRSRSSRRCARPGRRSKPISVRISATDWVPDGGLRRRTTRSRSPRLLKRARLRRRSTSPRRATSPESQPVYGRMYQVPFAEQIRHEAGIPVMAVGAILGADHANTILAAGRADLCAHGPPAPGRPLPDPARRRALRAVGPAVAGAVPAGEAAATAQLRRGRGADAARHSHPTSRRAEAGGKRVTGTAWEEPRSGRHYLSSAETRVSVPRSSSPWCVYQVRCLGSRRLPTTASSESRMYSPSPAASSW